MRRWEAVRAAAIAAVVAIVVAAPSAAAATRVSYVGGALEIDDVASSEGLAVELIRRYELDSDDFFLSASKELDFSGDCVPVDPAFEYYRVTLRCGRHPTMSITARFGSGRDGFTMYPDLPYVAGIFDGGAGNDGFVIGDNGSDTFTGGPGHDSVEYLYYEEGITAIPDGIANDGAAGEHDNIGTDVESLSGSSRDDLVVGSDVFNQLHGGLGRDQVFGLGGDDVVDGGEGEDLVDGGPGHDEVSGAEANHYESPDRLECGPGFDFARVDKLDTHRDCENGFFINQDGVHWNSPWPEGVWPEWLARMPTSATADGMARARRSGRIVVLKVSCRGAAGGRCRGSVRLDVAARRRRRAGTRQARARSIGRARFSIPVATRRPVPVRLNRYGRHLLATRRAFRATAVLRLANSGVRQRSRLTIRARR